MDSIPSPHSFIFSDEYICQWDSCLKNFGDAERLYEHLIEDHVGRKANHNLCLTCRWDKCAVPTFVKRDHITSHLRVHVPSKPYHCEICRKGFKRPQDLKKHEKIHLENADADADADALTDPTSTSSSGHLQPGRFPAFPLTPPTILDRSPSVASATTGSSLSPYSFPLSPANTAESWNPGLSSPSYSTNSDLFSSPNAPDLELDMMNSFDRPIIDVSGAYFGAFPGANGHDDMVSPMSAKRSRDGFDEVLSETLGAFAVEAKKKRTDASYNEDMMGRLNALSAILEVTPMTPDRLLSSLPEVSDWDQFNQFNQFCSTLFEDVSGEAFEPQSYDTPLFPEYEQKQTPVALDAKYGGINGFQNYNNAAAGLNSGSLANYGMGVDSIYSTVIPDDPFVPPTTSTTLPYGSSDMQWNPSFTQPGPSVMRSQIAKSSVHQPSRFTNPQYVSLPALQQGSTRVKVEADEPLLEHKVIVKVEREFADMSTQTKGNQNGMMMKQRPSASRRTNKSHRPIDAEALLDSAPDVPDTPLPETDADETVAADGAAGPSQEQQQEAAHSDESHSREAGTAATVSTSEAPQSRAESYMQKLRARQAAAAAATAAETPESIDPVEAMSRQLAQTRLDESDSKYTLKPSTTKPITAGDMKKQIKAATARSLCLQDPVRKQHAEVILNLLKNIDTLMTDHREKVAHYKATQIKGATYPRAGSGVHVQNQGQIRTVSSYLPRRGVPSSTAHRLSPLRQDHAVDFKAVPDYSQLRSNLTEGFSYSSPAIHPTSSSHSNNGVYHTHDEVSTDAPVLYPTSDLHHSSIIPFELSEEERRFIEEDNAKIAATQAADYHITHV